jgi:hypothetical protein
MNEHLAEELTIVDKMAEKKSILFFVWHRCSYI